MTTASPMPAQARPLGPSTRVSVIVLVVGLVVGAAGLYFALAPLVRALVSSPTFAIPGEAQLHLGSGTYLIYERTGSSGLTGVDGGPTTIQESDVTVTSEDGARVLVLTYFGARQVISSNGDEYTSALQIDVPSAGRYDVRITSATPGRVLVARRLTDTLRKSLAWWGAVALGGIMAIAGVVMWIVGASRRRRQRLAYTYYGAYGGAAPNYGGTPAGWYPDPQQPGRVRYWDGTVWTEHVN